MSLSNPPEVGLPSQGAESPARGAATSLSLDALAARLEQMERLNEALQRQRQRLRWVLSGSLIIALGALGTAGFALVQAQQDPPAAARQEIPGESVKQPPPVAPSAEKKAPEVLRVKKLTLLDSEGRPRAVLGVDETWPWSEPEKKTGPRPPGLYLRDEKGRPRLALVASTRDGSMLQMLDADAKPSVVMASSQDRQLLIGFLDAKGVTRGMVGLGRDDKPMLILRGNQAYVGVNDLTGTTRALLGTFGDGEGGVVIQDKTGKAITQLP
jgi:hypothetical protein